MENSNKDYKFNSQKERYKIALIALLLAGACVLSYYCQAILKTRIIFTHFFYIPIILATLWWKEKGIAVAIFLAGFLFLGNVLWGQGEMFVNDFFRAVFFVVIAFLVVISKKQIENEKEKIKEIQSQLIRTAKLATLGEMSAGLAHEINQPLSGITLTAKNLRKLMERDSLTGEEIKSALGDIDTSIDRITKIIQHVRAFARQDTFNFVQVDVQEPIENALGLLGEQLRLHEIEVIKEYSSNLCRTEGEPYQLEQVIINLISNACDAMDEKGNKGITGYRKELILKTEMVKNEICMSVTDNGIGMSKEEKDRIFEPFFTTKDVDKAVGLGMSISYGIIETHHGRIEVESIKDKGTTVRVFLPEIRDRVKT